MESTHNNSYTQYKDTIEISGSFENTNPFSTKIDTTRTVKSGKRPRIMKPLYSARLR
ncbi:hypothetical protein [Dyadobacter arcticus]|uniref:Uncharacterized protein n=1 Tax=Dyadobacter arcticus TaxID=1078754 RepID=A0ABX0UQ16_9BACT|nr:hypothetical protein [Dyadobacter arcticus]NIJ53770.1 hypothetical protein [Dyadobacter arcticus]